MILIDTHSIFCRDGVVAATQGITITACTRGLSDPDEQVFDPTTGEYAAQGGYDDSLGYELVAGAVTDWMRSQYSIKTQNQRIVFSYTLDRGTDDTPDVSAPQQAAIDIVATNAGSQLYTSLTSYNAGDSPPTGLAASYLATVSALQWSGSVTLAEQTAGATAPGAALGGVLNIAGGANGGWAAMGALIVGEETEASTGRTTLTFGPALHLSPQDLVARLYLTRPGGTGGREGSGARGTGHSDARTSGQPGGGDVVPGSTTTPKQNASAAPGGAAAVNDFSLYDASSGEQLAVGVTYGSLLPAQQVALGSGVNPWPDDFGADKQSKAEFDVTAGGTAYLAVTVTPSSADNTAVTATITGISLNVTSGAAPVNDASHGYWTLGTFSVVNGKMAVDNSNGLGSLGYLYASGGYHYFW